MSTGYPVVQKGKVFTPNTASGPGVVTNAATNYQVFAANPDRVFLQLENQHATGILIYNRNGLAYTGGNYVGFRLQPGGSILLDVSMPGGALNVASETAGCNYYAEEG